MLPVFQYENFVKRVKQKKREKGVSVFGILICDYRQQLCREYILNYLNRFHKLAGKNIDFYLPGYVQDYPIYEEFLENLSHDFDITFPYNPILILMEYKGGNFKNARKVVIELDSNKRDIKKVGKLFEEIFATAQDKVDLNSMMRKIN